MLTSTRHEPTEDPDCYATHCYSCGVDEPGDQLYMSCGECWHVYPSARSLRQARRRRLREQLNWWYWWGDAWSLSPVKILWRQLTVRARDVGWCQECLHDF